MPFDRAAYMREYRSAVREGKPTNIRGGLSRKATPLADPPVAEGTGGIELQEGGESHVVPWVPLIALLLIIAIMLGIFWFSSRGNTGPHADQEQEE